MISIFRHPICFAEKNKFSIFSFLLVGASSAIIYFFVFSMLWLSLSIAYPVAVSVGYVSSVVFHFYANRRITFQSHQEKMLFQVPKYLVMVFINYLMTLFIVHVAVERAHLSPYLGIVASIGMTTGAGYLMSLFWVFKREAN